MSNNDIFTNKMAVSKHICTVLCTQLKIFTHNHLFHLFYNTFTVPVIAPPHENPESNRSCVQCNFQLQLRPSLDPEVLAELKLSKNQDEPVVRRSLVLQQDKLECIIMQFFT